LYDGIANKKFEAYGESISARERKRFLNENQHIPVLDFFPLSNSCGLTRSQDVLNLWEFHFCNRPNGFEYLEIHPPSFVYTWYAEQLEPVILEIKKGL
jgi:hypothetical protein